MDRLRSGVMRHVTTAVVVLCLQTMAVLMTLRRDPVTRFEGTVISATLWWTTRPAERSRAPRQAT